MCNGQKKLFYKPDIFVAWWLKPLICQTLVILQNIIHSIKYQNFASPGLEDKGICVIVTTLHSCLSV